jgi:glyoxylase-like metal-dependent hydrolase (beta-lactamase superfamily II)
MFDFTAGRIRFILGGRYPHCHTVIVDDARRVLMDAASDGEKLAAFHRERAVDLLITSHAHEDHIMYNVLFPDARFWVHESDAPAFTNIRMLIDQYGLSREDALAWEKFLEKQCNYRPRKADRLLADGDILDFGHTCAGVIHAPGHTTGHCCFFFPQEKVLFLADYDLVKAGPYYGDVSSDIQATIDSLNRLAAIEADTYLTAHGKGIFPGSPELILNYRDSIFRREEQLLDLLTRGPRTLAEITAEGIIYGKPKSLGAWDLSLSERMMMKRHLERLEQQGKVFLDGNRFCLH